MAFDPDQAAEISPGDGQNLRELVDTGANDPSE